MTDAAATQIKRCWMFMEVLRGSGRAMAIAMPAGSWKRPGEACIKPAADRSAAGAPPLRVRVPVAGLAGLADLRGRRLHAGAGERGRGEPRIDRGAQVARVLR